MAIGDDFNGPGRSDPAPARPHEPFQKTYLLLEGFVVPQGGRRASGRRGGSGSDVDHLARQSPKNVAQARRFLGLAGAVNRGDPPPSQPWRPALPVPPAGPPPSELRHAIRRNRPGASDPAGRNADRERSAGAPGGRPPGGAANEPWKERFFSRAVCSPPRPTRARPQDGIGSARSAGGCVRPATSAGSRTRRTRAGACDRWRGQPGGLRRSTRPRGGTGRPPGGLQTSLGKNVLFKGGLQPPPRAIQSPKPFSNGLAPRSPTTRARISSKAASPAESQGKAADWRCIHAHFPVKNRIIP